MRTNRNTIQTQKRNRRRFRRGLEKIRNDIKEIKKAFMNENKD